MVSRILDVSEYKLKLVVFLKSKMVPKKEKEVMIAYIVERVVYWGVQTTVLILVSLC